ncbi:hypothetical protein ACIBPB_33475 [Micromonospora sp. NPDC049836]|uniref:hypothetical protein n=1 Tax=Micromonospora sp. NPDC049836 TaxID=3364274 RepID=UPI00378C8E6C
MGIKRESTSDETLAQAHKAGTPVRILQHAEHARFGTITYEVRRLWKLHYMMARSGYLELQRRHERVLRLPILPSNDRMMAAEDEPDLTLLVYVAGTQMVINTVLTMQHLCQEMEASLGVRLERSTLGERTREALGLAKLGVSTAGPGYSALREILERRDAVEHPKRNNVFNSHPNDWDRVPLNWFLTERAPRAFELWDQWFGQIIADWKRHPSQQPQLLNVTLQQRGVKSTRQAKKPPKGAG